LGLVLIKAAKQRIFGIGAERQTVALKLNSSNSTAQVTAMQSYLSGVAPLSQL
jgi:hypothetical protein